MPSYLIEQLRRANVATGWLHDKELKMTIRSESVSRNLLKTNTPDKRISFLRENSDFHDLSKR